MLTVWEDVNRGPEPSQVDNDVRNMQWVVKEVIHKNKK